MATAHRAPFALRGLVEGFYGPPWSPEDRRDLIAFLAAQGANLYLYAPKNDEFHRDRWREPYPAPLREALADAAGAARQHGLRFAWALAPGLCARYHDERELDAAGRRFAELAALGIEDFALLFDDVDAGLTDPADRARFEDLPAAQGAWVRALAARHRAAHPAGLFLVCPTDYAGADLPAQHRLARLLPEEVFVLWTGPAVFTPRLTAADVAAARATFRRPLVLWDNFPVNDFPSRNRVLHLSAPTGRDPDLATALVGLLANPMAQAQASKIALHAGAAYWRRPACYNPAEAWGEAIAVLGGPGAPWLRVVAEECLGHWQRPGDPHPARSAVETLRRGEPEARALAGEQLRRRWQQLVEAPARLRADCATPRLAAELAPLTERLAAAAALCLAALAAPADEAPAARAARRRRYEDWRVADCPFDLNSPLMPEFLEGHFAAPAGAAP